MAEDSVQESGSFSLSELDVEMYKLLEEYKGMELKITIEFFEDLGIRVEALSAGSIGRSGDSTSITTALLRLLPKVRTAITEYDEVKAEILARLTEEDDED